MPPTGDRLLNVDLAQIWADVDDPNEVPFIRSCCSDPTEFIERLRQLPQCVRDSLHAEWLCRFEPRDDGGLGLYVIDDLWTVWEMNRHGAVIGDIIRRLYGPAQYWCELYFTLFPCQPGCRPATTERGLIRKINRWLPEHQKLRKARPHHRWAVGTYYVVDHNNNTVVASHIDDLERFFADSFQFGCLAA